MMMTMFFFIKHEAPLWQRDRATRKLVEILATAAQLRQIPFENTCSRWMTY